MRTEIDSDGEIDMESLVEKNSMELSSRMISKEIENNPNSSHDLVAASNWKQMRVRNRRMTMRANQTNSCWAMCRQRNTRDQQEIFDEHLINAKSRMRTHYV